MLYQGYKSNAESSTRKLEVYEKRIIFMRVIMKYPATLLLGLLLLLSSLRFYKREQRTITRVLDKGHTI